MDRSDSTTFRYLRERMAAEAKVIEAAIAPPPPAEQASGEHVEALTKLREREWETADAFGRLDAKWFSRQEAAFDAAIAALSPRPVVDEAVRGLADESTRSEESREGKECVRPCKCRGAGW